ncbi:ATP-binding cassette domain-containing protein [bacterium]|nr:ATP-binding cassette domain-containing protein [bacterium]
MSLSVKLVKNVPGFSLDVEWEANNEFVVLFGYSGAGKSMSLQIIAGLLKADEGYVYLNGDVLFDSKRGIDLPPQKRQLGYVFQNHTLFPHMPVWKNIAYGGKHLSKREREERIRRMIKEFHLEGLENRFPSQISGGQKRRVALATVLMREPKALLLDEPLSALDSPIKMEIMKLLREVKERFNIPIVLVTHDIFETFTLADKVVVYIGGRVAQIGAPYEVFRNPANPEVARLFCAQEIFQNIAF